MAETTSQYLSKKTKNLRVLKKLKKRLKTQEKDSDISDETSNEERFKRETPQKILSQDQVKKRKADELRKRKR